MSVDQRFAMTEEFGSLDLLVDEDIFFDYTESPLAEDFTRSSPDTVNSWIGEIESQLMNDEQLSFSQFDQQSFLADIFVDCPPASESSPAQLSEVPAIAGKEKKPEASNDSGSDCQKLETEIEGNDDVVAKKRTRRERNRDAAVRSRERKKEYVEDLEKKSKYLERECMRLGRMLDCFVAENHWLRQCLGKGSGGDAFMTKQESAVLLLESLLLGSLLWYLGGIIICQFPQPPRDTCPELDKLLLSVPGRSSQPSYTRRCKGSRPRMKHHLFTFVA